MAFTNSWNTPADEGDRAFAHERDDDPNERRGERLIAAFEMSEAGKPSKLEELEQRFDAARELVLKALLSVESGGSSGIPLLSLDVTLTRVLAELGCRVCGKAFHYHHARELVVVRHHAVCAIGDCHDVAHERGLL